MNKNIKPISEIIQNAKYYDSVSGFFGGFSRAWNDVKGQVLKIETRQTYDETGNESYDAWINGDHKIALELMHKVRKVDVPLYNNLNAKAVDFIRCRPIRFPISSYLLWEMECYKFNSRFGEKIFFVDYEKYKTFEKFISHDFMVFDTNQAFIHNYDTKGLIQGGWIVSNQADIELLIMLFALIKANSKEFNVFLNDYLTK